MATASDSPLHPLLKRACWSRSWREQEAEQPAESSSLRVLLNIAQAQQEEVLPLAEYQPQQAIINCLRGMTAPVAPVVSKMDCSEGAVSPVPGPLCSICHWPRRSKYCCAGLSKANQEPIGRSPLPTVTQQDPDEQDLTAEERHCVQRSPLPTVTQQDPDEQDLTAEERHCTLPQPGCNPRARQADSGAVYRFSCWYFGTPCDQRSYEVRPVLIPWSS